LRSSRQDDLAIIEELDQQPLQGQKLWLAVD